MMSDDNDNNKHAIYVSCYFSLSRNCEEVGIDFYSSRSNFFHLKFDRGPSWLSKTINNYFKKNFQIKVVSLRHVESKFK
jgi:hypothetical protein